MRIIIKVIDNFQKLKFLHKKLMKLITFKWNFKKRLLRKRNVMWCLNKNENAIFEL